MTDWLKIKLVRDFKKLSKYENRRSLWQTNELIKIKSSYSKNYLSLMMLITNTWQSYHISTYNCLPDRIINIKDLDNINIDLLEKVVNLKNVNIVELPIFNTYYIEDLQLITKTMSVSTLRYTSTLEYLKNNQNKLFYIYDIDETLARWCEDEDKKYLQKIRKEKLKKIEIEL